MSAAPTGSADKKSAGVVAGLLAKRSASRLAKTLAYLQLMNMHEAEMYRVSSPALCRCASLFTYTPDTADLQRNGTRSS